MYLMHPHSSLYRLPHLGLLDYDNMNLIVMDSSGGIEVLCRRGCCLLILFHLFLLKTCFPKIMIKHWDELVTEDSILELFKLLLAPDISESYTCVPRQFRRTIIYKCTDSQVCCQVFGRSIELQTGDVLQCFA